MRWKKTALLHTLAYRVALQRFANLLFCGLGFICLCEEKKQKIPRIAPAYQRSTGPINPLFYIVIYTFSTVNSEQFV